MIRRFPPKRRQVVRIGGAYLASSAAGYRERDLFTQVQTYCMFVGYPRSGHSLVGSLLDAHPDMVIAHELDDSGSSRTASDAASCTLILNNSRRSRRRAASRPDLYRIPNQWQGRFRSLRVIGDKRGMTSMSRIQRRPQLLDSLQRVVRDPVRFVHVVRNPFDNISTMAKRRSFTLEGAADMYFGLSETVATVQRRVGDDRVFDVRHQP